MEKIEEMNNIDNSTTQKEEIEKNEVDNEFINIQTENAENKEKFEKELNEIILKLAKMK